MSRQHKLDLKMQTGSLGPSGYALWKNTGTTTGPIFSMKSAPVIYNTQTGLYQTVYDASAFKSSPSFKKFSFGNRLYKKARMFGMKDLAKQLRKYSTSKKNKKRFKKLRKKHKKSKRLSKRLSKRKFSYGKRKAKKSKSRRRRRYSRKKR